MACVGAGYRERRSQTGQSQRAEKERGEYGRCDGRSAVTAVRSVALNMRVCLFQLAHGAVGFDRDFVAAITATESFGRWQAHRAYERRSLPLGGEPIGPDAGAGRAKNGRRMYDAGRACEDRSRPPP